MKACQVCELPAVADGMNPCATLAVYADLRWPEGTGIGAVQQALLARVPETIQVSDLRVTTRIGSPASPVALAMALRRHRIGGGVFWSPGYMPPLGARVPVIVTVHDLTHLRFYSVLHRAYYEGIMKRLYRGCTAIICVSEHTRQEFISWSGMSLDRVFTIHNGVSEKFFVDSEPSGLQFPYVLYSGNHRRYKNLSRLIEAYALSSLPGEGIHLVMTGPANDDLRRGSVALGVAERLHFLGSVTDQDIVRLYRGALLVAFVSLYEGFGLPILEGMASGVPVLTSNVSSMPEIAGDAALLVDPSSVAEISKGLDRLTFDGSLRESLIRAGKARASRFDWGTSAGKTWEVVAMAARAS